MKNTHKNCVLYSGTEILQTFCDDKLPENISKTGAGESCYGYFILLDM
jgi:hypothetical protein